MANATLIDLEQHSTKIKVRENKTKKKLKEGKVAMGVEVQLPDPRVVDALCYNDLDYLTVDNEAGTCDLETMLHCCIAAQSHGVDFLVKIADNNPRKIQELLNIGAQGFLVAHINTAEDARLAVAATRFPPEGIRGFCPASRSAAYNEAGMSPEYVEDANKETLVVCVLEEVKAMNNLPSIIEVPGVDVIWPGIGDLSVDMGLAGQFHHPRVNAYAKRAVRLCKEKGIPTHWGGWGKFEDMPKMVADGTLMLSVGTDIMLMMNGAKSMLNKYREMKVV